MTFPPLPEDPTYWFVGASWGNEDQTERFLYEGVWENGYGAGGTYSDQVARMRPGERIAIKSSFVKQRNLPFDAIGKKVSAMRIKATGTILEAPQGAKVAVKWDTGRGSRDWYFYTFRNAVWECDPDDEKARQLIEFAFEGAQQDYGWWLAQPYFASRYRSTTHGAGWLNVLSPAAGEADESEGDETGSTSPAYTTADIVEEGCFVPSSELDAMLGRLRTKLNVVLQGPPGTGKTWLAKRLAAALIGQAPEVAQARVRVVQFHPSYSYEDFVRGYRPKGDDRQGGRLDLVDGVLLEAVETAKLEGDRPFVLVIEEINRGNPAQIFGETLTLLEHDKRARTEAVELAYRRVPGERVHLPPNLYVIGTMNVADRSLALVDLALRRRFAFLTLRPRFDAAWQTWCEQEGKIPPEFVSKIGARMEALNKEIGESLGGQFAIGHSYVTPARGKPVPNGPSWFHALVETEIGPLLEEYWYETPEKARAAAAALVKDL